ncbi:MAG: HNH endonuclease [Melioribacteraceae bacterium]|nr:HNH endonuclease [Melioribacteraceae bacterium]MCF8352929.1 HNH endonuclease [Melioribacteraceae bacterium]MCF8395270.1 HNH endonuclease [Melioribacteraceae bacterium]MCF8417446.1 HNH endonuclease [Melioribacteraceae bacterium]
MLLIFLGKAELVNDNTSKKIHSVKRTFPWPSVIRLNSYIRIPQKKIILSRKNIIKRDKFKCAYCGRGDLPLTVDHIIPKSRGGEDIWENLTAACLRCNNKKGDRTPAEADMPLRIKPYKPNYIMFLLNTVQRIDENWRQFLYQV